MTNYPESPREAARAFTPELTDLINGPLYSEVWTDERLSPRDRSIAHHPLRLLRRVPGRDLGVHHRCRHAAVEAHGIGDEALLAA